MGTRIKNICAGPAYQVFWFSCPCVKAPLLQNAEGASQVSARPVAPGQLNTDNIVPSATRLDGPAPRVA